MKRIAFILPIILLAAGCNIFNTRTATLPPQNIPVPVGAFTTSSESLVGVWQNSPVMGAGWTDTYQFFKSGKYNFRISSMSCAVRARGQSGTWSVTENQLTLKPEYKLDVVEGTIIDDPVCGKVIKGGKEIKSSYTTQLTTALGPCIINNDDDKATLSENEDSIMECILIEDKNFYKFSSDPTYNNDPDLAQE